MIADIQKARASALGFRQQHIERVVHIFHHLARAHEAVGVEEFHVVGVERIGQHKQGLSAAAIPIGKIIIEGIGGIGKTAFDEQGAGPVAFRTPAEEAGGFSPQAA